MIATPKERQQQAQERDEFIALLPLRNDFEQTFGTPHGMRVLTFLMERGHLLETTCTGNAWSHFYEGERNFVLKTIGQMIPALLGRVFAEIMRERQAETDREKFRILDKKEEGNGR